MTVPSEAVSTKERYTQDRAGLVRYIADIYIQTYITLRQKVWDLRNLLDNDTLEYLTSPVSVQKLDPDKWDELYLLLQNCLPADITATADPDTGVLAPHCARCRSPLWFQPCDCHRHLTGNTAPERLLRIYKSALEEHGWPIKVVEYPRKKLKDPRRDSK